MASQDLMAVSVVAADLVALVDPASTADPVKVYLMDQD